MKNFNEKQLQVINDLDNNLIVLATAGTGKTDTLVERISNILKQNRAKPTEILCLTFTNKACKEMKERITDGVGNEVVVRTFHSWCFDIVKKEAKKKTDFSADFILYDEDDCKNIVEESIKILNKPEMKEFSTSMLVKFISSIKEEKAILEMENDVEYSVKDVINYLFEHKQQVITDICKVDYNVKESLKIHLRDFGESLFRNYTALLKSNRGIDFADLILTTATLFREESIVETYCNQYKYIHVDEVQDTNIVEYYIIEKILANSKTLLCGDIFQTIYAWRGSSPKSILDKFRRQYHPVELAFHINYRATKNLVKTSLGYLEKAFSSNVNSIYRSKLEVQSSVEGDLVEVISYPCLEREARGIYEEIRSYGSDKKVCILARANNYCMNISEELKKLSSTTDQFEFLLVEEFKFFRRSEIKDILAVLKVVVNPYDAISFQRVLMNFNTNIGEKTIEKITSTKCRQLGIKITDFLSKDVKESGDFFHLLLEKFNQDKVVVFDVETTGLKMGEDQIIQIAAVKIDRSGKEIARFDKLLQTVNRKKVGDSQKVHNISDQQLEDEGEDKVKVLQEFLAFIKDSLIVGHNVSFDIEMLENELTKHNLGNVNMDAFYDTLDIYRRFYPNLNNHKLGDLSREFATNAVPDHNAMNDILATGELLVMAIQKKIIPTAQERTTEMRQYFGKFTKIVDTLHDLQEKSKNMTITDLVSEIDSNLISHKNYQEEKREQLNNFYRLVELFEDPTMSNREMLLDILKISGLSNGEIEMLMLEKEGKCMIPVLTVHQAKGLEFDVVFLVGLEDYVFPTYQAIANKSLEEEKRIFYVAISRAKERLVISYSRKKVNGKNATRSCFLNDLPKELLEEKNIID